MTPKQLQRLLSRATLILAALGGGYLWMRYEVLTLPESGCSPLAQVAPGSLMWIDLAPSALRAGDAVFFELVLHGGLLLELLDLFLEFSDAHHFLLLVFLATVDFDVLFVDFLLEASDLVDLVLSHHDG